MGLFKMYKLTVRNNFLQNINLNSFFFFFITKLINYNFVEGDNRNN